MAGGWVGALDHGTTGTRFVIFDSAGKAVSWEHVEHRQIQPRPGWVEHDPEEILRAAESVIAGALARAGLEGRDLAAIGVTNQRETVVAWDRATGRPLHNAIVWQDVRTREICQDLEHQGLAGWIRARTGLPLTTYFSAPKLRWLLESVPGLAARAEAGEALLGTMDAWLIWWLTGGPGGGAQVSVPSNASRTMLMDLRAGRWDADLMELFGVPAAALPELRPSSAPEPYGLTSPAGPAGAEVPVTGDLGDQQAALLGQGCLAPGEAKCTYGTGSFLLMHTGSEPVISSAGLVATVAWSQGPARAYALEGSVAVAGAAVRWLRDILGISGSAAVGEPMAAAVPDSGGICFVPAFSGLFAPTWDMDARGVILGLTGHVDRRHIARATLEGICYQTVDVVEAMERDAGRRLASLRVDGGASANDLRMQTQADVLGRPVVRLAMAETTALGAACAAGLAAGFWASPADLAGLWRPARVFEPTWSDDRRLEGHRAWRRAVDRARGWLGPG